MGGFREFARCRVSNVLYCFHLSLCVAAAARGRHAWTWMPNPCCSSKFWWRLSCSSLCFQGLCRKTPSATAFRLRFVLRFGRVPNCGLPARLLPRDRLSAAFSQRCQRAIIFALRVRAGVASLTECLLLPPRGHWPCAGAPPGRRGEAPEERESPWPSPRPRLAPPCRYRLNVPR